MEIKNLILNSQEINILVISDNVCPWCFVAKRKMEEAISKFPHVKFHVDWMPFFLERDSDQIMIEMPSSPSPSSPSSSRQINSSGGGSGEDAKVSIADILMEKYGAEKSALMLSALRKAGGSVNINWNENRVPCSTLLSHQLVVYSKAFNKQNETVDAIFRYYFEKAQNISRIDVLVKIAREIGLDYEDARKYLQSGEGEERVRTEAREVKLHHKITGVPTFMISRPDRKRYRLRFSGAQPVEVFEAAFRQILDLQ